MKQEDNGIQYRYLRIQGREIVENTMFAKGVFTMMEQLMDSGTMEQEDKELMETLSDYFMEKLPFPVPCQRKEKVVCYFKTINNDQMLNYLKPLLWLLDKYEQPYYLTYTNYPGEIIYEDNYQIVVKVYDMVIEKVERKTCNREGKK